MAAVRLNVDLRHGHSKVLPVLIGTSSCLPDHGYVVPADTYEVLAILSVKRRGDDRRPTGLRRLVVIGPTIEVTPADHPATP